MHEKQKSEEDKMRNLWEYFLFLVSHFLDGLPKDEELLLNLNNVLFKCPLRLREAGFGAFSHKTLHLFAHYIVKWKALSG